MMDISPELAEALVATLSLTAAVALGVFIGWHHPHLCRLHETRGPELGCDVDVRWNDATCTVCGRVRRAETMPDRTLRSWEN